MMRIIPKDDITNTDQDLLAKLKEEANRKATIKTSLTPEIKDLSETNDENKY